MFVAVHHRIHDPETAWALADQALAQLPPGVVLHQSLPSADGRAAVCLWEAESVDAVRDLVEGAIGHVSENEYFAVGAGAEGLPERRRGAPLVAVPSSADAAGVAATFRLVARPGARERLLALVRDTMLAATRAEPGCLSYRFYQDVENPDAFSFVEEWASWAALESHFRSAHVGRALAALPDLLAEPPRARFHGVAATRGAEAVEQARAALLA